MANGNKDLMNALLDSIADQASKSQTMTLAHHAASLIANCRNQVELENALENIEVEPLDALHSLIGSYLEDRSIRESATTIDLNEPF